MFNWNQNPVCLVEGPADTHVLLALRPELVVDDGGPGETVTWDDGDHLRAFPLARVLQDEAGVFQFEDDSGRRFSLRPLTAARYGDAVQPLTGGPALLSDKAVQAFYLAPRRW